MAEAVHLEAIELILASISGAGEFELSSFMFGRPGAPMHERNLGTEVFADRRRFIRALLFLRRNGAGYLRNLSIGEIWSRTTDFLTANYWYIAQDTFGRRITTPYACIVNRANKIALADALAQSPLFVTPESLSLFPLLTVRCESNFENDTFFLVPESELTNERVWGSDRDQALDGRAIPPFAEWTGRRHSVVSWLGVHTALPSVARKIAAAILGSIALTQIPRVRYLFSGREMYGGVCVVDRGWSYTPSSDPHTPPLMQDIILTAGDSQWLCRVAELLESDDRQSKRQTRALEYFYRAWFLDPRERFPALCMSLDSLVGAGRDHTAEAIRYVQCQVPNIDVVRLRLLMRIRGAVIHGAAPDVYESENYGQYYADYEADPIRDLELIVSKCLREDLFGGLLQLHPDPNQQIITRMQSIGRLPPRLDDGQIIPDSV